MISINLNIYIADYAKTKVLQLPIIPSEMPSLSSKSNNEEFESWWNGTYNFIEKEGLITLSLESWLPTDASKYNFCKSKVNASEIIELIKLAESKAEPIRFTITGGDSSSNINDTFSVELFSFNVIKRGDYKYSLSLKQWREYKTTVSTETPTLGWNKNGTGWWYVTDATNNTYYKDCWQLIENEYYSFDSQGYARQSKWLQDGGYWYYLKDSCKMARNEWVTIDGKSYYLGDLGGMYANSYTPDGYWVNENGEWIK